MSAITINTFTIPNYHGGGASATLRIYSNQKFQTSDGVQILKSKAGGLVWYKSIACTVSGTVITVPQFTIDSNTNSNVPSGSYTGVIFDSNGQWKDYFFKHYVVPHDAGTPIDWSAVVDYNDTVPEASLSDYFLTAHGTRFKGFQSGTGFDVPNFPADKDWGFYYNSSNDKMYLVFNNGGDLYFVAMPVF